MYSRTLGDRELSFGVSGKLWHGILVMYDRNTRSLWTQIDGRSIQGNLTGAKLEHRESTFTTWAQWRGAHPDTLVLAKSAEERLQAGSHYADYFADPHKLFLPHLGEAIGGGVAAKQVVFGVLLGSAVLAIPETLLAERGELDFLLNGQRIRLVRDLSTGAVTAEGADRVDRAYWYAWKRSHPESLVLTK